MSDTLLPPKSTPLEKAIAKVLDRNIDPNLSGLWNAQTCPVHLLPWLAWALRVDEWSESWPEQQRRDTVEQALGIAKKAGTVWAVKRALAVAGFPDAELVEGLASLSAEEQASCTEATNCWAYFAIRLPEDSPTPLPTDIATLYKMLRRAQRESCVLKGLQLPQSLIHESIEANDLLTENVSEKLFDSIWSHRYNGEYQHDSAINYDAVGIKEIIKEDVISLDSLLVVHNPLLNNLEDVKSGYDAVLERASRKFFINNDILNEIAEDTPAFVTNYLDTGAVGILLEYAEINTMLQSTNLAASVWAKDFTTTASIGPALSSPYNAYEIRRTFGVSNYASVVQPQSIPVGAVFCTKAFFKLIDSASANARIDLLSGASIYGAQCTFPAGTVEQIGGVSAGGINILSHINLPVGEWRYIEVLWRRFQSSAFSNCGAGWLPSGKNIDNGIFLPVNQTRLYSSVIPSTSASASRAVDKLYVKSPGSLINKSISFCLYYLPQLNPGTYKIATLNTDEIEIFVTEINANTIDIDVVVSNQTLRFETIAVSDLAGLMLELLITANSECEVTTQLKIADLELSQSEVITSDVLQGDTIELIANCIVRDWKAYNASITL